MIEPDSLKNNGILTDDYVIDDSVQLDNDQTEAKVDIESENTEAEAIEAVTSSEDYNLAFWQARNQVINSMPVVPVRDESELSEATTDTDPAAVDSEEKTTDRVTTHWVHPEQQLTLDLGDLANSIPDPETTTTDVLSYDAPHLPETTVSETNETQAQLELWVGESTQPLLDETVLAERIEDEVSARLDLQNEEHAQAIANVEETLRHEQAQREHAETHLRITRKALVNLESKSRADETENLNQRIELEDRLAESIRQIAIADARADREAQARAALELELKDSRRAVLEAKQATSKNLAARAKALKTANKAIAFARQTIDARSKVETNARQLKETIESQQATIGSLINSLESEQAKALEEKSFLAKQLILKEKSVKVPVTTEDESESLAAKLVQKVARSSSNSRA